MIHPKLHIDLLWMNKISIGLQRFKKVKTNTFCCRCPVCGDSKKDTKKTRFFFYVRKQSLNVMCHNCGYSKSFYNFMREQHPSQFEEYKRETLFDTFTQRGYGETPANTLIETQPTEIATTSGLTMDEFGELSVPMSSLPDNHPALQFLKKRAFTQAELDRVYFTDDFKAIALAMNQESAKKLVDDEPRILIPFTTPEGTVEVFQGRALVESKMKYITIKAHDDVVKVYGRYWLDRSKTTYCVEGPIDSMFVDNCIATCDANLIRSDADVLIFDNQCRNKDVCKYMEQAIEEGRSLVIWPFSPSKKIDINDMVKMGITRAQLMSVIKQSTFKGLTAKMKFMQWKRL